MTTAGDILLHPLSPPPQVRIMIKAKCVLGGEWDGSNHWFSDLENSPGSRKLDWDKSLGFGLPGCGATRDNVLLLTLPLFLFFQPEKYNS